MALSGSRTFPIQAVLSNPTCPTRHAEYHSGDQSCAHVMPSPPDPWPPATELSFLHEEVYVVDS